MSTNARIGVMLGEHSNVVRSIYLHWDGYPEAPGAGDTLVNFYPGREQAENLIELGNLSALGDDLEHCDRYDEPAWQHANSAWPDNYGCIEWEYLFHAGSWWGREVNIGNPNPRREFEPLAGLVVRETARVEAGL